MSVRSNTSQYTPVPMRRGITPLSETPLNYHESPLRQVPPLYPLAMVDSELSHTKICGKGMIDKILGKHENNRQVVLPFGGYHPFDGIEVPDSPITVYSSSYGADGTAGDTMPEEPTDENALQFSPAQILLSADKHGVEAQHTPNNRKSNASTTSSSVSSLGDQGSYSTPSASSRKSNKSKGSAGKSKSSEKRRISSLFRRKPPTPFRRSGPLPAVVEVPSADASDVHQESSTPKHKNNIASSDNGTATTHPFSTSSSSISSETDAVLQAMRDLVLQQQEALKALAEEKAQYARELEMQRASVSTLQSVNHEQSAKIHYLASTNQQVQSESEWLKEQIQAIRQDMVSLNKSPTPQSAHEDQRPRSGRPSLTGSEKSSENSSRDGHQVRQRNNVGNSRDTYLGIPPREKSISFTDSDSLTNESGAGSFPAWTNVEGIQDLYQPDKTTKSNVNVPHSVISATSTTVTRPVTNHGDVRSEWGDTESLFASISDESLSINFSATPTQSFDVFQSNDGNTTVLTPKRQNESSSKKLKPALRATKITVSGVDVSSNRSVKFNSPLSQTSMFSPFPDDNLFENNNKSSANKKPVEVDLFRNRLDALQERREQRKARQTTIRWDEKFLKESKEDQQNRLGYF